ncbi:protein-export membrane protein [Taylorella asinigenitalis 14/45]|uniref:Protein-export membrane protein SecF n=1 Tax=Taylorella asinigenitalis 14/45 TaxID=1091495 RepID=I7JRU9_9BURK|nr:protein translocase subunit SecF [Taylorella asinigenitalis]CCG19832.1 protein-export membrane protein [Taylorella asinigenitalis 14/45]
MEFFKIHKTIPFMKHALILNIISLVLFLLAVFFIATKGFNLSIEFTGGTLVEAKYDKPADLEGIRKSIGGLYSDFQVQNFGSAEDVLIRLPIVEGKNTTQQSQEILSALKSQDPSVSLTRVEFVGPQIGNELYTNGLLAFFFVIVGICVYLAFRFEWKFSISGVVANVHDVIIILGFFAFFQWEFSLTVLAAILAVLGYSVNESVVVMDRIRENFRKQRKASVVEIINSSITQTISRTIITHGSTQIMVLSMFFLGGPSLHYFSLALTIGIWFGIYSSIFVAAAVAMWLGIKREDMVKPVKKQTDEQLVP